MVALWASAMLKIEAARSITFISLDPQEMTMDFIKIRFEDDRGMVDTGLHGRIGGALRLFDPALTLYTRVWHPLVDIYETVAENCDHGRACRCEP